MRYLDFQKAFDKVPHLCLLSKSKANGIRGSEFKWIENFVSSRKQRDAVRGSYSNWTEVISGVPQCSVSCLRTDPFHYMLMIC